MLLSVRADFEVKKVIRNKQEHYLWIKVVIFQENIIVVNMCMPKKRESNYVRQKLIELQKEKDDSTITVGDFSTPLSDTNISSS